MSVLTPLKAITITASEQSTAEAAIGSEDITGTLSGIVAEVAEIIVQLNRIVAVMPSGANQTAINSIITTLA